MFHSWKNGSQLKKCVAVEKNGSHLNNVSQLEKRVTLKKMLYSWKNKSHLKVGSHLKKCVTVAKMGHT